MIIEKQTHKNDLFADEMESATESGDHGGLQRWQLTIVRLAKAKESCTPCIIFDTSHR